MDRCKVHELSVYTSHLWYNLSCRYLIRVVVSFKMTCRDNMLLPRVVNKGGFCASVSTDESTQIRLKGHGITTVKRRKSLVFNHCNVLSRTETNPLFNL